MNQRKARIGLITVFLWSCLLGSALAAQSASKNDTLLSAASLFEDLTEHALAANTKGMNFALNTYAEQAAGVRKVLSARARQDMDASIVTIKKAVRLGDNETVALKSVEVYRILIESLERNSLVVPVQVSLLDYAGFKFKALLHAKSTDWSALKKVAEEARQNWEAIQARVADKGLRDAVGTAIQGMSKASTDKNAEMAIFASQIDLALVDLLEGYFERSSK